MASTSIIDPVMLFIEKMNQDQLIREKIGVFDGTNISKYFNIYYDEIEMSGVNDVNMVANFYKINTFAFRSGRITLIWKDMEYSFRFQGFLSNLTKNVIPVSHVL